MKLYKYLISGGLALTLSLSSCESWLEVEPNDTRTTDYFYSTPSEMEQAIIGIYNGLLPISDYSWLMSEVRSDNAWVDKTTDKQRDYIDIGTFNPNISTISTLSGAWNNLYEIIARANMFLSKTDGVTFSSEAIKNQFIGEAKFLRALAYFDLVRYFGRIPIVLEPVSVNEAMTIKQSEPVEVYETAIVPDLEDAVKKLVDTPLNYMGNSASAGRATQVAAKSLLGRVYLTMAGYPVQDASKKALAEELFSEVIDYSFANNKYWASILQPRTMVIQWYSTLYRLSTILIRRYKCPVTEYGVRTNWTVFSSKPTKQVLSLTNVVQELSIQVNLSTKTELHIQEGISS